VTATLVSAIGAGVASDFGDSRLAPVHPKVDQGRDRRAKHEPTESLEEMR
jgi:hypothetical protein